MTLRFLSCGIPRSPNPAFPFLGISMVHRNLFILHRPRFSGLDCLSHFVGTGLDRWSVSPFTAPGWAWASSHGWSGWSVSLCQCNGGRTAPGTIIDGLRNPVAPNGPLRICRHQWPFAICRTGTPSPGCTSACPSSTGWDPVSLGMPGWYSLQS